MDFTCDEIEAELRQLKEFSFRLGESMDRTAAELREQGTSPSAEFISDLQHYREVFFKMRSWLQQQSRKSNTNPNELPSTLDELASELTTQMGRHRALQFIEDLSATSHVDGPHHPAIVIIRQACQVARDEIREHNSRSDQTVRAINQGQHPLTVLWTLITDSDSLDDNQWTELLEKTAKTLSPEVATAVARHKFLIPSTVKSRSLCDESIGARERTIQCSQSMN